MPTSIRGEQDILPWAIECARRFGDDRPTLVQHASGTRAHAADALGWGTDEQTPVFAVAIQGEFTVTHGTRPPLGGHEERVSTVPVLFRVIEIATGRVLDAGARKAFPDLSIVGPVVTDLDRT